jgi:transaldolase
VSVEEALHHHRRRRPRRLRPARAGGERSPATAGVAGGRPRLAHDTDATAAEAAHLWWLVDRKNLYIKIPATEAGSAGDHDVHLPRHQCERHSHLQPRAVPGRSWTPTCPGWSSGCRGRRRGPVGHRLGGVVLRVPRGHRDRQAAGEGGADHLKGKAALANAQLAYQAYEEVFSSDRWKALAAKGASPQRPLWASTG